MKLPTNKTLKTSSAGNFGCFPLKRELISPKIGFSLIELLVVISLFALVAVIVTVSYIGYESREKVKNSALQLVSELRFAQNRAKTGDKVSNDSAGCQTTNSTTITQKSLAGWYVKFDTTSADKLEEYEIGGVCVDYTNPAGVEAIIGTPRVVSLADGVIISSVTYGATVYDTNTPGVAHVFFRPINLNTTFHNQSATSSSPPTFLSAGSILAGGGSELVIVLGSTDGGSWEVKVTSLGNIENRKL